MCVFFFKQKTAYEMRISDWSSDVCSSDLYTPKHFEETQIDALHELIRAYPFATVVTHVAGGLAANHLPFELVDGVLHGHVARAIGRASCRERVCQYV